MISKVRAIFSSRNMKIPAFKTLRFKISFFIIILLLVTVSLFTFLSVRHTNEYILSEMMKRAESLSKSMAAIAPYSILSSDIVGMDNIGWKVKEANSDILYAAIMDLNDRILAHTDLSKRGQRFISAERELMQETRDGLQIYELKNEPENFEILTPLVFKKQRIGTVVIGMDKSTLLEARAKILKEVLVGLGMVLVLGTGSILILSSLITRPIRELSRGVEENKFGRIRKLHIYSDDELGKLTASFNQMTDLTAMQQKELGNYAQELEQSYLSTIKVLTAAIDARDPYTLGHSTRVAKLALSIGKAIGLSRQELDDLEIASLFHDVGKLKTPDYVLLKEGPLDAMEQREITSHCEYGVAILSRARSLQKYIPAVRHHHEWFNGDGYPDGLRGDQIPLHAAIIAIADAFDAMTSVRPYKSSFTRDDALEELTRFSGRQFDPSLVDVFKAALDSDPMLAGQFSGRA